jgi:hypothetical protein
MFGRDFGPAIFVFMLLGGLMIYIGGRYEVPYATNLGIVFIGLMFGILGAQMIASQAGSAPGNASQRLMTWAGRINGGMLFALGGLILLAAAANFFLPGGMQGYMDRLLSRPSGWGLLLCVGGGFSTAYSFTLLFGISGRQWKGCSAVFENLRQGFFGLVLLIGGMISGLVGLGLIVAPDLMASLGQLLIQMLNLLLA